MKKGKALRRLWAVVALFAMMTNTVLPTVEVFANETNSTEIQESALSSNELTVDSVTDSIDKQSVKENLESEAEIQSEVDQQENANANDSPDDKKKKVDIGTQAATTSLEVFHGIDWYYDVEYTLRTEDNGDEYIIRTMPDGTYQEKKLPDSSAGVETAFNFSTSLPHTSASDQFFGYGKIQNRQYFYRITADRKKIINSFGSPHELDSVQFDNKMEFGDFIGTLPDYYLNENLISAGNGAQVFLFHKNNIVSAYYRNQDTNKLIKVADSTKIDFFMSGTNKLPYIEINGHVFFPGGIEIPTDTYMPLPMHTISTSSDILKTFPSESYLSSFIGKSAPWWENGVKNFPEYSQLQETSSYKIDGNETEKSYGLRTDAMFTYLTNVVSPADFWSQNKAAYIANKSGNSDELVFDFATAISTSSHTVEVNCEKDYKYTFKLSDEIVKTNAYKNNVGKHFYSVQSFDIKHLSNNIGSSYPEHMVVEYWLDSDNTLKIILSGDKEFKHYGSKSSMQAIVKFENLTFPKEPRGKVSINKYETGDTQKELIADAEFTLYKKDGTNETEVAKKTSEKGKELVFENLELGDYVLRETQAPAGYETATYEKEFKVTETALAFTYEVANTKTPEPTGKVSIKKYKTGDTQKELIADAEFTLYKKDGTKETEVAKKTSVKGKELVFDELALGDYVLKETKAPAGYETATYEKAFTVTETALAFTYEVANTKTPAPTGKVTIKKHQTGDTDKALIAGATFTLTNSKGEAVKKTTKAGEELVFDNLAEGTYTLEETSSPAGYEKPTFKETFEVKDGVKLDFEYTVYNAKTPEPTGKVTIKKHETGDTDKTLIADAEFTLTDSKGVAVEKTTKAGEELVFDNLAEGTYTLEETSSPAGYEKPTFKETFEVKDGVKLDFEYTVYNAKTPEPTGKVTIKKHQTGDTDKKLIADAEFTLTDSKGIAVNKTTKAGEELVFDNLAEGTYTLEETSSPAGYEKPDFKETFEVKDGVKLDFEYTVYNAKTPEPTGKVTIKKHETGDTDKTLISGAEFTLTDSKGVAVEKTTKAGEELVFDNLSEGTYTLEETSSPAGYEKPTFKETFEVKDGVKLDFEYTVYNAKTPEPTGKVTIKKHETGDTDKALIADAEFTLTDSKGKEVKKTTKAGEELVFDNLAEGTYTLEETSSPAGYEKPTFKETFEVKDGVKLDFEYTVYNAKTPEPTGKVTIKKHETGDTDKALIADAEFTLTNSKGEAVKKTTKAGAELVFDNLAEGTYTLEETSSPAGYEKPDFRETFEVKDGVKLDFEYTVYNAKTPEPEKGKVTIKKYKAGDTTEALIADAEFTLYDADDKKISSQTTVEGKELVFDNLEYGKYTLKETKAPAGYEESTETKPVFEKEFEVTAADLNFEYKVANVPTPSRQTGKVSIKKYKDGDTTEALIGDAEFTLYDADGKEVAKKSTVKGEELVFDSLAYGKYTLKETKAPAGYEESTEAKPLFEKEFEVTAGELSFEYKVANKEIPEIQTSARDGETGTNEGYADEKVTIIDEVKYENLTIGKKYTVKGTLMDQATNQPFLTKDGKEVHAETSFDAEKTSGTVELTFEITNGDLQGKTVVVFEDLETEGKKVATHSDITDEKQSVDYPKVGTQASKATKDDKITVTDIVSYEKLTVGKEYTVKGTLMDKETGKAFEVDGKAVTAETPFKPLAENGTTEVTFEFDKSAIEGKEISLVVFEKVLNADGKVIGTHEDLKDSAQTVEFKPDTPVIETSAKDSETGTNEGNADEKVTIIDTVTYKNLTIGKDYTIKGILMDKATNQPFLTKDGKEVHAEKDFTADKSNGTIDLEFVITNGDLAGKTVVVFETLYREGVEVAVHADIEDKNQSVDYPKVGTKASKSFAGDTITVTDIVSYEKLTVGKEYTVKGTLMDKETGKAFEVDGKAVTAEAPFTPTEENGTTEVTFEFDRKAIEGKEISLVVFEKVLNADGKVIGTHEDLEDSEQTVEFNPDTPEISTTAKDSETGTNEGYADEKVSIIDTVHYDNLTIGKTYTVSGVLMDKATNQPFLTKEGKEVRAEKEFVPDATNGSVDLEFVITNGDLQGKTVVVFETLYRDGKEVAAHTDIEDKDQSVDYPKVGTKASEKTVGDKIVVTDIVAYEKLTVGKKYTVKGTLMDKATGKAFEVDGKAVTAEATFTPETENGTTEVSFEFAQKAIEGKEISLVVFEKVLNADGKVIGTHEDLEDPDQTVSFNPDTPEISTKAKDKGTASNEGNAKKDVTIIDEVSYRNLIVGKEYTVKGVLMDKATNQPLLANGKEVRAEKTFTAKKPNGTIDLEFTFDGSALAGATVVVFETLYTDNKEVATHTDINDVDQTVTYPKVGTKASESTVDNTVVIKDIVSYENLVVGKKYTVKGVLMDKSTGLAYRVDGKKVLGETTFVAETASGTVEVAFEFAKSALTKKETLVVFEQLFNSKGYLVGTHEDINDKDQTVEVGDDTPGKPGLPSTNTKSGGRTYSYGTSTSRGSLPKTGSVTNPLFVILGLIIIGSAVTFYFVYIRRAKRNH